MKEFDLEAAKAGKKVMTRDGRNVRIVCFDCKDPLKPIVALVEKTVVYEYPERHEKIEEDIVKYSPKGKDGDMNNDLVMASEKKEGYVNLFKSPTMIYSGQSVFETEDEAKHSAALHVDRNIIYLDTIKIEWEE